MRFDEYIISRLLKAGFKPWQPRTPAGNGRESGRWIDSDGFGRSLYQPAGGQVIVTAAARLVQLGWTRYGARTLGNLRWILNIRPPRKTPATWLKQIRKRGWTPEEVTNLIKNGKQYPAPNGVNKGNTATRYVGKEKHHFVVRDNKTKEILQLSDKNKPGFEADTVLRNKSAVCISCLEYFLRTGRRP